MKIALNTRFGGFALPEDVCKELDCDKYMYSWVGNGDDWMCRTDPDLISALEKSTMNKDIEIFKLRDGIVDGYFIDYDGKENFLYTIDTDHEIHMAIKRKGY